MEIEWAVAVLLVLEHPPLPSLEFIRDVILGESSARGEHEQGNDD
jgi:hypothetical protein